MQCWWRVRRALAFAWRLRVKGVQVNTVCWCKFSITLFPPLAFLQNTRSHLISLSSESTRDTNLCGDDEFVAVVGIELPLLMMVALAALAPLIHIRQRDQGLVG